MSSIKIHPPEVKSDNEISIKIDIPLKTKKYFKNDELVIKYDFDVSSVPASILTIPAVTLVCPVAWATGVDVTVDEIDQDYYRSMFNVREGFERLYPGLFDTESEINTTPVENTNGSGTDTAMLFSGGVDSTTSYYRHRDESPTLINIVQERDDEKKIKNQTKYINRFSEQMGVYSTRIYTNAHSVLDVPILSLDFIEELSRDWWNAIHYGIYYMAVCAPYTYYYGVSDLHQGSSYTSNRDLPEAQPFIVESLSWTGTTNSITEDEFKRHEKISVIADFVRSEDSITISSCYNRSARENCMNCEKCFRTALGAAAVGVHPDDIGFPVTDDTVESIKRYLEGNDFTGFHAHMWREIQDRTNRDEFAIDGESLVDTFLSTQIEPDVAGREVKMSTKEILYKYIPYPVNYIIAKTIISIKN